MVKSPRIRHSKSSREPVTIDLEANEIGKKSAEKPADTLSAGGQSGTATGPMAAKPADADMAAKDNATKLLGDLTLEYNKARQAGITQEILEIAAAQFAA